MRVADRNSVLFCIPKRPPLAATCLLDVGQRQDALPGNRKVPDRPRQRQPPGPEPQATAATTSAPRGAVAADIHCRHVAAGRLQALALAHVGADAVVG